MKLLRIAAVIGVATTVFAFLAATRVSATTITKPGPPLQPFALGLNTAIRVTWRAPKSDGGSPITGYTVTFTPGPKTCKTNGRKYCTLAGLTNGKRYYITVQASNVKGLGKSPFPVAATPNTKKDCGYAGLYANLEGCNPIVVTLMNANLTNDNLTGANLYGQSLKGANLTNTDFLNTDLYKVSSGGIVGTPINLPSNWELVDGFLIGPGASLDDSVLSNVDLSDADLSSDSTPANIAGASLTNVNFTGATLNFALFGGAYLTNVNMTDADLEGARMTNGTTLTNITWSNTTCPDGTNSDNDGGTCVNNLSF